jgi:threonine dehydratase
MPQTAARVKVDAIRECGAEVDFIDVNCVSRTTRLTQLQDEHPDAYVADSANDSNVVDGNATLGRELATFGEAFDDVVVPIGGGGLAAGIARGLDSSGSAARLTAAEPLLANDAARSFREGRVVELECEPPTLADGARVSRIGDLPWAILQRRFAGVLEVQECEIAAALRLCFTHVNLKVEPTAALSLAAVAAHATVFRDRRVCCVITGANVDPELYFHLMTQI